MKNLLSIFTPKNIIVFIGSLTILQLTLMALVIVNIICSFFSIFFHGKITYDYIITASFTSFTVGYFILKIINIYQEELKESEEKYRSMMEAFDDTMHICSSDFRIEYMNPAMIKRTGRDATGELCHKVIHGLDEKCPWCTHKKVMRGENTKIEIVSPKGDKTYYISNSPVSHADGSVSMLTVSRDITKIKKMEDHIQQIQKMEAIGTLAGGIAHDFNNILSGIFGHARLVELNLDSPIKAKGHISQIVKGAQRAAGLTQQILTFSHKTEYEKQPLNLYFVVKEALNLLRSSIPSTIEIRENIISNATILADSTQIHQVIMNLCTNAYHAMRNTGGVLNVKLNKIEVSDQNSVPDLNILPGKYFNLEVSDTGKGMDEETLRKIFDPYFTTKGVGEGTGLGLALVYGIIEDHRGYIKVYSNPGKGSIFSVFFPITDKKELAEGQGIDTKILMGGTERVMVVDDDESILSSIKGLLEDCEYKVSTFPNAIQAFNEFKKNPYQFDLIITDMTMPKMTGDELSTKILKVRDDLPIILCTGYSENMSEIKALEIGIKKYLQKPIDSQRLLLMIREVLDNIKIEN